MSTLLDPEDLIGSTCDNCGEVLPGCTCGEDDMDDCSDLDELDPYPGDGNEDEDEEDRLPRGVPL